MFVREVISICCLLFFCTACNFERNKSVENPRGEADAGADNTSSPDQTKSPDEIWTVVAAELLNPSCISCHGSARASAGIDLSTTASIAAIRNKMTAFVVPGAPHSSRFYTVITSGKMPPGGRQVSSTGLDALARWIVALKSYNRSQPDPSQPPIADPTDEPVNPPTPVPSPSNEPTPSPSPSPTGEPAPVWADIRDQLLTPYQCLSCHEGEFASASVDLSDRQKCLESLAWGEPSMPVVVPENPGASRLLQVLIGGSMPPSDVEPLPGMPVHPTAQVKQLVEQWILRGAP